MVANMELNMVAHMEVDKVADWQQKMADMEMDMVADNKKVYKAFYSYETF